MLAERRGHSDDDRLAADNAFHAYLEQATADSENGIMMPLSEHPSVKKYSRVKRISSSQMPIRSIAGSLTASQPIAQFDGGDDDEDVKPKIEADEDAINSDLDDSEDELENPDQDDQEGGNVGETILCTYDKVQRVKNKVSGFPFPLSFKPRDMSSHKEQQVEVRSEGWNPHYWR